MKYTSVPCTSKKFSNIVLGTMQFLWTVTTEKEVYNILDRYIDAGGTVIDTADIYTNWAEGLHGGEAETLIGKWMKRKKNRDKIILITKVRGRMWEGADGEGLSRKHIIKACEQSLRRLQIDYIDIYLSHWSDLNTPIEETLLAYQELLREGKVGSTGCSNYTKEELKEALAVGKTMGTRYTYLEAYYNLIERKNFEQSIIPLVQEYHLTVLAYGPLAGGFLTGEYRKDKPLPQNVRAAFVKEKITDENLRIIDTLELLAKKYKATISQIALAWVLHKPFITAPIIGVDTRIQLEENSKATNIVLEQEDSDTLNEITENVRENNTCDICFRIACKKCDWVANEEEVLEIQKGILTACPKCGWSPGLEK